MSIVDELKSKTVFELKSYAKKNNIDVYGVSTKLDILEIILNFIPKIENNIEEKVEEGPKEKVAIYSQRNLYWAEVGQLSKGYNIVSKEDSEKWLMQQTVRLATPQEVLKEYKK